MKLNYRELVDLIASTIVEVANTYFKSLTLDAEGIIVGKNENNTYKVSINKQIYNIKNGTVIDFQVGNKCLIHYISGNQNKKVIIAKL